MEITTNWKLYLDHNPDLKDAGINTEQDAIQHFLNFGMNEKRSFVLPPNFDWKLYLLINSDIKNEGITTEKQAIQHYLEHGIKEKRKFILPSKFDWEQYILLHGDLKNQGINTEHGAARHYTDYGIVEKRNFLLAENFDWELYLLIHPDLKNAGITTKQTAIYHYFTFGIAENRECGLPVNFDWKLYLLLNPDLKKGGISTEKDAIKHYCENGIKEDRNYQIQNFEWEQYLQKYPDLVKAGFSNEEAALRHYITYGRNEGRNSEIWESTLYLIGEEDISQNRSAKFIRSIPNIKNLRTRTEFEKTNFKINDILIVQHLVPEITPEMIWILQNTINCRIIIHIFDFWWFDNPLIKSHDEIQKLFQTAELVIHSSQITLSEYSKYLPSNNFILSQHIKSDISSSIIITPICESVIRIGWVPNSEECSGSDFITFLQDEFKTYNGYEVEFLITDISSGNNFLDKIKERGIHCLFLLNNCDELSTYLKSGLPILYNSVDPVIEHIPYTPAYKQIFCSVIAFNETDKAVLKSKCIEMLDSIISANQQKSIQPYETIDTTLYEFIFKSIAAPSIMEKIYDYIKPFCIYFPQFHKLAENDHNYYPGMTDTTNLLAYIQDTGDITMDRPADCELPDYDLSRKELVLKQVETAKQHGIYGFCIYYYWFSQNSITNKNTIMESCYDHFFDKPLDNFTIYFNWANEDWTKNPSFVRDNTVEIANRYTDDMLLANFQNLSRYFQHPNYYKIEGAPVFGIYHPWFMQPEELARLEEIFTTECQKLGFAGIHIIKNCMAKQYETSFLIAPNYKNHLPTDEYELYIPSSVRTDTIQTMFFSFNNTARMYKPKIKCAYKIRNPTYKNQFEHLKILINSYKNKDRTALNKIFLINSWNEWGEDMAVEPGLQKQSLYLDMIKTALIDILLI
jgi:hypothetical protein